MSALRRLLDVRKSTPKLTCLLEAGVPSLQALVKEKQSRFFKCILKEREDLVASDPLMFTLDFMKNNCASISDSIQDVIREDSYITADRDDLCEQLRRMPPEKTKLRLYLTMNSDLLVHPLYKITESIVEDNLRMAFTRVRLCSHRLRSETGRWNRVPADQRFCPHCDNASIQNEEHLLLCPATLPIREKYGVERDLLSILTDPSKMDLICLKQCLKLLESTNDPNPDE